MRPYMAAELEYDFGLPTALNPAERVFKVRQSETGIKETETVLEKNGTVLRPFRDEKQHKKIPGMNDGYFLFRPSAPFLPKVWIGGGSKRTWPPHREWLIRSC